MDFPQEVNVVNAQNTDQNIEQQIRDNTDEAINDNDKKRMNCTVYVCARDDSRLSMTKRLLERGVSANEILHPFRRSALQRAQDNGAVKTVKLLLKWDANPFLAINSDGTLLYRVCNSIVHCYHKGEDKHQFIKRQIKIAQLLLELGADPNERDDKGQTLLFKLIHPPKCALPMIELLVRFGADATVKNEHGHNALFFYANVQRYRQPSRGIECIKAWLDGKTIAKKKKIQ